MTADQFEALVFRLEKTALERPEAYQRKVLLLALLGNAYVVAMLLFIAAMLVALFASVMVLKAIAIKFIVVVGFFLWMIVKALWVKVPPPEGTEVTARHAPELFAMVEELGRQLGAPRFHHVLVTDDFNAAVEQSPRLGLFGWSRNYLLIGLPLMKTLTVDQFKAVLAHEFGHLAKGHGRMTNWIYRQRLRWSRLVQCLESTESRGSFLFKPFLNWFVPYFNAYSFPMARANEYEADRTASRLTSPQAAAAALTGVNVIGSYLEERYWPRIYKLADDEMRPGFTPFSALGQRVCAEVDEESAKAWLKGAMDRQTSSADTHPALAVRLKAIGEEPRLALPAAGEAADRLLGSALEGIVGAMDRRWLEQVGPAWERRYQEVQESRRQLAELNGKFARDEELSVQEAYDRARLTESVGGDPDDALAQFRLLHERKPDDSVVCLSLGARLLAKDDEAGCVLVEHAMEVDEGSIAEGCEILRDYHWRHGREEVAKVWHQKLVERVELQQAAAKERNQVTLKEKFEPHGLPDDVLAELQRQLKGIPGLRKAYLVKKRVAHLAHLPCYVLGYKVNAFYQLHSEKRAQEVLARIQATLTFPGETLILNVEGGNYKFGRKLRWMRKSRIV